MIDIEDYLENRKGTLFIDGLGSRELISEFGSPLYVYSMKRIVSNYDRISSAFKRRRANSRVSYAVKANNNLSVLNILRKAGAGADCSGIDEIMLAKRAGYAREQILYSGNYNTDLELETALDLGVTINLDDRPLLARLLRFGRPDSISFRANPGVGKGKYRGLVTAGPDAKFGMGPEELDRAYGEARRAGVARFGLHMMTGSNVLDPEYFAAVTDRLMAIASGISARHHIEFDFIDIGGGFGVPYEKGESELPINEVAAMVVDTFEEALSKNSEMGDPSLVIEPGRYLVADAGVLLSTVTHVKRSTKSFIGSDAGMNTLLRPALYESYHEILPATRLDSPRDSLFDVTGQVCENTDIMGRDRTLPTMDEGDILAFLNCGAYGFSMASHYNSRPLPAEILIADGKAHIVRDREGSEVLLRGQHVPDFLQ